MQHIRKIGAVIATATLLQTAAVNAVTVETISTNNGPKVDGIHVDVGGNVYISKPDQRIIRKITSDGTVSDFFVGVSSMWLVDITSDLDGNLYATDWINNQIIELEQDNTSSFVASVFEPNDIVISTQGISYVAAGNSVAISAVTPTGDVSEVAILSGNVVGLAIDEADALYAANSSGQIFQVSSSGSVTEVAQVPSQIWHLEYAAGNLYAAGFTTHQIYKITPEGEVCEIAGTGEVGADDGTGDVASFSKPLDISADSAGEVLYISENTGSVRKLTLEDAACLDATSKPTPAPTPTPEPASSGGGASSWSLILMMLGSALFRKKQKVEAAVEL